MNTAQEVSNRLTTVVIEAMRDAKLSQREVADATGIPLVTLSRRLTYKSAFTVPELAAVCEVLKISILEVAIRAERLLTRPSPEPLAATA